MPVGKNKTPRSLYDSIGSHHQADLSPGGGHKLQSGEAGCGCVIS